ncbi:hypothetical protein GCM10023149_42200 [Mucilaginibacter gynuensis]|uniref:TonB C-terminal domain-containing protein n=1 Tax=Mucilaginibacter gynuensis TaxID=1302236 RepID=A0ABP8H629_9SPHI
MTWWQYLLLANLYLVLFYGFYALLLRKETFFQLNRIYLVAAALLSFLIPAIQADWVKNLFITRQVKYVIYNSPVFTIKAPQVPDTQLMIGDVLGMLYGAGVVFLIIRLAWQLIKLNRIIKQPEAATSYSFFNKIKLSETVHHDDAEAITSHEEVHAKQWHSVDVLLIELIMIFNWFNPVVYLYRSAIKHIHEFIADSRVIATGIDKAGYAMLLLKQTFNNPSHTLVNPFFNHSLLKQRIMMLQKNRSQRIKLIKYGLSAPLFALMLVLSSATVNESKAVETINKTAEQVFATPATPVVISRIRSVNNDVAKAVLKEIDNARENAVMPATVMEKAIVSERQMQTVDTVPDRKSEIFTQVEEPPHFPGGMEKLYQFLGKVVNYPKAAVEKNIQGKVIVSFIVEDDGQITHIKSLRAPSPLLAAEAVRAMSLSPKWSPGVQNDHTVRVQYTMPINFTLTDADGGKKVNKTTKKAVVIDPKKIKGKVSGIVVVGYPATPDSLSKSLSNVVVRGYKTDGTKATLDDVTITLNGKEITKKEMDALDPKTIASIDITKDAEKKTGEKGYSTIAITTKK